MSYAIQHDMSRKLQASIADVLMRETALAHHVCSFPEIALIMIEASVMLVRTTAGTIANTVGDEAAVQKLVDETIEAIIQQVRRSQPDIVSKVIGERKARAA